MHARFLSVGLFALLFVGSACTATSRGVAPRTPSFVGASELQASGASNLYDAIARTRPAFFATRGATSILAEPSEGIVVIINRSVQGGLSELRMIDARIVRSIRRLNAAEVYSITGRSAPAGGIEVVLGP